MSPFEIRSTYSADTFRGLMTLSSVRLKPSMTFLKSPWCLAASARTASLPSSIDCVSPTPSMLEGKLAVSADAAKHQGDFKKLIEGFNLTLDNVIKPLNVSAEYVDRISKGDIPPKITDTYQGDFNEIKNNLNVCIDALSRLVSDGVALTQSMLEGKLAVRADAAKHQGDFKKVIDALDRKS